MAVLAIFLVPKLLFGNVLHRNSVSFLPHAKQEFRDRRSQTEFGNEDNQQDCYP